MVSTLKSTVNFVKRTNFSTSSNLFYAMVNCSEVEDQIISKFFFKYFDEIISYLEKCILIS